MSIIHKDSHSEKLTKKLAIEFSDMDHVPGERQLNAGRLDEIQSWLETGDFSAPQWARGLCREDGKHYRLNGQHTSKVLSEIEGEFPNLTVTIMDYEFDSLRDDAPKLFNMFDNPVANRTNLDMLSVYRVDFPDVSHVAHKFLERYLRGVRFYEGKIAKKTTVLPVREKGLYLHDPANRNFISWLWTLHAAKHHWLTGIEGVCGEMLADFHYNRELAEEFWGFVLKENHEDVQHTTRELSTILGEWKHSMTKRSGEQYYNKAKIAWDRYRRLRELEMEKTPPPPRGARTVEPPAAPVQL